MQIEILRAGAGRAEIELPAELFPTEGFTGVHDPLHARLLFLESGNKLAVVSIELTSLPADQVAILQASVGEATGLSPENVLICVTHTFSAPHFLPPHLCKTAADQQKNELLLQAIQTAVHKAASQAVAEMKPARFGYETGFCDVNVNRDILTADGWWLGSNETGPTDKSVTVLRFETLQGNPIALLFSYAVQPSVMDGSELSGGGRLVSADLAGAASRFLEQEYGEAVTALFCLGAAADQAPALKAKSQYIDKDGHLRVEDIHESGFSLADLLGKRLGIEVLHLAEKTRCQALASPIFREQHRVTCPGQKIAEMQSIRPTKQYDFIQAEERDEPIEILRLGEVVLIGVRPELGCLTAASIKKQSPFPTTLVLTMVNGAAKYMPELGAYERITYAAMNSSFARGSAEILSEKVVARVVNLAVEDFQQLEFDDPKTGITLKYNLYVPRDYEASQSYPLVLFIHDAGVVSTDTRMTLLQGLGGVIWATPSEQAKHASFVLAPQYPRAIVNDNSEATQELEVTVDLIKSLATQYNLDQNRLYTTGQSMGCMASIALLIKYPDLFAAALLVAGQWDATKMSVLTRAKMWVVVAEGDRKAFPGMNASLASLEAAGAKISRATWNGQASAEEFAFEVKKMIAEGNDIKYTVLQKGTVVPAGLADNGGNNHVFTWPIVYAIEGPRDWLFSQSKISN